MPGDVAQQDQMIRGHLVEIRGQRMALVLKAGVVVAEADDPSARRGFGGFAADEFLDFRDVAHAAHGRGGEIKLGRGHEPGRDEMAVSVDEAGKHGPAAQVRDDRVLSGEGHDLAFRTRGEDDPVPDGEGFGPGAAGIHGQNGPVAVNVACRFHVFSFSRLQGRKRGFPPRPARVSSWWRRRRAGAGRS